MRDNTSLNILFVGSFVEEIQSARGGQEFACTTLVKGPLSEKVNWHFVNSARYGKSSDKLSSRIKDAGKRLRQFVHILKHQRIDIILIFSSYGFSLLEKGLLVFLGRRWKKPIVFAPRSGIILKEAERSKFKKWVTTWFVNHVTVLLCQSLYWKKYYSNLAAEKTTVQFEICHNWLDVNTYMENKKVKHSPHNDFIKILFLGSINKNKGIFDLIDAAEKLKKSGKENFQFIVAGTGGELENAKQLTLEKNLTENIDYVGMVEKEEKMKLLRSVDIFVLLSYFEGFPNALLEAMASELAVVATKVGSVGDIIISGKNGFLVEAGDVENTSKYLEDLIANEDLREHLSENAQTYVRKNNSIEKASHQLWNVFTALK